MFKKFKMRGLQCVLFFWLPFLGAAQITITNLDQPLLNDPVIVSNVPPTQFGAIDFSQTGTDYSWDFCDLEVESQQIDTMVGVSSTPFAYQFYF